jgi:hypothetical protein
MAYKPVHNFRHKDKLPQSDPEKIIYGSDLQDEFEAISGGLEKIEADLESVEGGAASWDDLTGKPNTFPPQAHTHSQSQITGLEGRLNQIEDSITSDGGFVDAPDDGKLYGRQSENWEEIVLTGGDSGIVYTLPILLRSGDEIQLPLSDDGEHLTVMLRAGEIDLPLEAA